MCCSFAPADFSNTIVYADRMYDGQHLLGYQNTAKNLAGNKVNAMLLPLPATNKLGPQDMIDTESCPEIFKDMKEAIKPKRDTKRSLSLDDSLVAGAAMKKSIQIFKSGVYTILLCLNASYVKLALGKLPENERPEIANDILEAYQTWYPNWQMALCIWSGSDALNANPILWKFNPMYPEKLFLPGLDSHDGTRPNLNARVYRDHSLIVGSRHGQTVNYKDVLSSDLDKILPKKVRGEYSNTASEKNGDWWVNLSKLDRDFCEITVAPPPGAN